MAIKVLAMVKICTALFFCAALASCSNDLSRSEAEKQLQSLKWPIILESMDNTYRTSPHLTGDAEAYLDKFKAAKWITYERTEDSVLRGSEIVYRVIYKVQFTNKLKEFIMEANYESEQTNAEGVRVLLYYEEVDKVTGIVKQDSNTCVVEFTTKYTPTPLAALFPKSGIGDRKPGRGKRRTFKLYDDGWRLQRTKYDLL